MDINRRILTSVFFIVLSSVCVCYAQASYTLDKIVKHVEQNHPMLQMYDQKVAAYQAYAEGTSSWMAPMVGVGTFMTPYPNQEIMHENEKGALMFSLEQDIPNPAKQKSNKEYYHAMSKVEEKSFFVQRQTLRKEVKELFYQSVTNLNRQHVLKENLTTLRAMILWTQQQYALNKSSLADIYKIESQVEEVSAMIEMLQGEYASMNTRLKILMNVSESIVFDTVGVLNAINNYSFERPTDVYSTRALQQIDQSISAMEFDQDRQRVQRKPDFKIRFDHMQPIGNMPKQYSAMAMVSIPIAPWSSKMYKTEIKGMQYEIDAMKKEREGVALETLSMLNGMVVSAQQMQKQLIRYKEKVLPALKRNTDLMRLTYEENQTTSMMVLESWEAYNMMQDEYWSKWNEYVNMIIQYETTLDL